MFLTPTVVLNVTILVAKQASRQTLRVCGQLPDGPQYCNQESWKPKAWLGFGFKMKSVLYSGTESKSKR